MGEGGKGENRAILISLLCREEVSNFLGDAAGVVLAELGVNGEREDFFGRGFCLRKTSFLQAEVRISRLEMMRERIVDGRGDGVFLQVSAQRRPAFMAAHTDFGTFEAMFEASGFTFESPEDFATIPDAEWDAFIASVTRFPDWKTMQEKAAVDWMAPGIRLA